MKKKIFDGGKGSGSGKFFKHNNKSNIVICLFNAHVYGCMKDKFLYTTVRVEDTSERKLNLQKVAKSEKKEFVFNVAILDFFFMFLTI